MSRKLLFVPLALFLLLSLAFTVQLTSSAHGDDPTRLESALIGKPLPAMTLASLANPSKTYDQALLRDGRPWLLNVWATRCPTCRAEHQFLNGLAVRGVRILGINYKDSRPQALAWLNTLGNPYTLNVIDGDGMLGLDLGVYGAPETLSMGRGLCAIVTPAISMTGSGGRRLRRSIASMAGGKNDARSDIGVVGRPSAERLRCGGG